MSYDSVCMNMECIQKRKAFFEFSPKNEHIINKHEIKNLQSYQSSYQQLESQAKYLKGEQLLKELIKFRDQACQTIIQSILSMFHDDNFITKFQESIKLFRNISTKNVLTVLREGNYLLLHPIKLFQMQEREPNFLNFFFQTLQESHQSIKNNFTRFKISLMETLQNLQKSSQPSKPLQIIQIESLSQQQFLYSESVQIEEIQSESVLDQNNLELQYNQYYESSLSPLEQKIGFEQQCLNSQSRKEKKKFGKYKSINKRQHQKPQRRRRKRFNILDSFQRISQQEFLINQSKDPAKTLEVLRQKQQFIKCLHFFDQKFATEETIQRILRYFSKIQRITLNCNHDFQPSLFKSVRKDVLSSLKFEVKWDMSMFFTKYYAYQHFPFRTLKKLQREKEINLEQMHKSLPSNNSLWINGRSDLEWINSHKFNYLAIDTIRFNASFPYGETMQKFSHFTNIKVLVLSGSTIVENSQFISFINQNLYLETIILDNCKFKGNPSLLLNELQNLRYLSKLSIVNEGLLLINPEQIFRLSKLTHLNIQSSQFINQFKLKDFENLKGISKMTKLKHLSLYSCTNQKEPQERSHDSLRQPLRTEFLSYLSQNTLRALLFLNLGLSKVDNGACQYIKMMSSLVYLNIDQTRIEGEALVQAFQFMSEQNAQGSSLRQLSIQNKKGLRGKYTQQHLSSIAEYLPALEYLNIAFIEEISDYDFSDFEKLKTIALSQSQFERLNKLISPSVNKYKVTTHD